MTWLTQGHSNAANPNLQYLMEDRTSLHSRQFSSIFCDMHVPEISATKTRPKGWLTSHIRIVITGLCCVVIWRQHQLRRDCHLRQHAEPTVVGQALQWPRVLLHRFHGSTRPAVSRGLSQDLPHLPGSCETFKLLLCFPCCSPSCRCWQRQVWLSPAVSFPWRWHYSALDNLQRFPVRSN